MTEQEQINAGLVLNGLDGANPLAFLGSPGDAAGPHPGLAGTPGPPLLDTA